MTIITFLGLIGGNYTAGQDVSLWQEYGGAEYTVETALGDALGLPQHCGRHDNMLPLLKQLFPDAKLVAVGTEASIAVQRALDAAHDNAAFPENVVTLESENDFDTVFRVLNSLLENEQEVIVDISHSFRHLPILMVINLIVEHIADPSKIRHILFARELEKEHRYEIVDLRRYLDLAGMAYALAGFTENYTVAGHVRVLDKDYQELLKMLHTVGAHLLGNSFEALFAAHGGNDSLLLRVIGAIDAIILHPVARTFERHLRVIRSHLQELEQIGSLPDDERFYALAKILWQKGYMLNAITLLDEAVAFYCLEGLRRSDHDVASAYRNYISHLQDGDNRQRYNRYAMSNEAKNLVKHAKNFTGTFLATPGLAESVRGRIDFVKTKTLRNLIYALDNMRNNLAHGNSDEAIGNVHKEIGKLLQRYEQVVRKNDPLKRYDKEDDNG